MKKILFPFLAAVCLLAYSSHTTAAATAPLWTRDVVISPDGSTIAFCYKGDIWTVPSQGGSATRMTSQTSYECHPVWSPDGSAIAFASDRYGNFDIFLMSSAGGSAKRLTFNSASETPSAFTPDGRKVIFSASIQDPAQSALFPSAALTELYCVSVDGGCSTQMLGTPAEMVCYSPDGSFFLYQDRKGGEDQWRKHHTSSITRDIWRYDVKSGRHANLTARAGEDRNPVLSSDGRTVFILCEVAGGSMNVWSMPLTGTAAPATAADVIPESWSKITSFDTHPVRFLSRGGADRLCFTWDGEIYTMNPGKTPSKVKITLTLDQENKPELMNFTSGAKSAVPSPDGKQVAFTVRGDVFVTSTDYPTTKQITRTAAAERNVDFCKDGRTLVYSSERDGISQLYLAEIARKDDPNFPNATLIEETPLLPDLKVERGYPSFSPDGKKVAFIENRSMLKVVDLATKAVHTVTDGSLWPSRSGGFDYRWSPDGKWFVIEYTANGHEPYNDVGIVKSSGGAITNITASGYMSGGARWALDGNAILFQSELYGMRTHASWGSQYDVFLCFLNQDAFDRYNLSKEDYDILKAGQKKKDKKDKEETSGKDLFIELDGISDRIVRLTGVSADLGDAAIFNDNLYYTAGGLDGGKDLWKMDLRKKETKMVSKGAGGGSFAFSGDGKTMFLFGSSLKKIENDKLTPISFRAGMHLDHAAEREYMFDYVYREERERFYTEDMNGVDWDAMTAAYRKFLPHIDNNYDFAQLLSEWLGELNVSHTGGRYYPAGGPENTASLGLLFDVNYTGKGMKVAEVVCSGPCDKAGIKIKKGDIIDAINGTPITAEQDISVLLAGLAGKKTLVGVKGSQDVTVIPVSASAMNTLLYKRWVKNRAADVQKWSKGRLGYVHFKSMNDGSFRPAYSDILGKFNKCEGIVIDTRFNGGGRMHEDIEILFSGEKYLTQVMRGVETCDMPSRRWNKPSIMLQCEANYSNAHGTPWVYKHQGIGKLVGAPVPGTMSSVNWVTLQDPSLIFGIPVIGYRTAEGNYLEGTQLEPDILVLNSPETIVEGEDSQLRAAVEELLGQIDGRK